MSLNGLRMVSFRSSASSPWGVTGLHGSTKQRDAISETSEKGTMGRTFSVNDSQSISCYVKVPEFIDNSNVWQIGNLEMFPRQEGLEKVV